MWIRVLRGENSVERNRVEEVGHDRTGLDKRAASFYNICCSDYMKLSKYTVFNHLNIQC